MNNLSIHPRNWPEPWNKGRKKSNTSKPQKKPRTRNQLNLEARRRFFAACQEKTKNPLAHKMPGSQKK